MAAEEGRSAPPAEVYPAEDSLLIEPDPSPAARRMLEDLAWPAERFSVTVRRGMGAEAGSAIPAAARPDGWVTFPSPRPRADPTDPVNTVVMEWYTAHHDDRAPLRAPAVLVLHILDGRMTIARSIARTLAGRGIHAFVMYMPGYGRRAIGDGRFGGAVFFELAGQAVADARRARDAIAALPRIDPARVSIQGTSLGGFIAAGAAAVDTAFHNAFIMLAGGNLFDMLHDGRRETAMIRRSLERAGFTGEALRDLLDTIDPIHIAQRLDPLHTWMFNATADRVVPAANARALAEAAGLDDAHHIWIAANHYTGILHLPWIVNRMAATILGGEMSHD